MNISQSRQYDDLLKLWSVHIGLLYGSAYIWYSLEKGGLLKAIEKLETQLAVAIIGASGGVGWSIGETGI